MICLYNEEGKRVKYDCTNPIGSGVYGSVYKLSDEECLKISKSKKELADKDILLFMKSLMLKNYYEIHDLLYNKKGVLRAYTMKYYQEEDIDILTMPTEYTLNNLFGLYASVEKLTENNIFISDMHTGNIILNSGEITIIDTDLYTFNKHYIEKALKTKNNIALEYLFREIYMEALMEYHIENSGYATSEIIRKLFKSDNGNIAEGVCKKLVKYKYPIDYIKNC